MNRELLLQQLLDATYEKGSISLYDYIAGKWPDDTELFKSAKSFGDQLVTEKLAHFTDEQRTILAISNFGRYWTLMGGYPAFLKDNEHKLKEHHHHLHDGIQEHDVENGHDLKEDLRIARLRFTKYRIITYWWSFAFSIISFFLSVISLYLILSRT
ncbi:hypothetical protein [Flavihumibacter sp. ZG627]|uniref:hypothetical protein n=1 Tax=Flavihumibacter sp. ZG627 TaxID=1463156 RepID=UPI000AD16372|nr:hypothetical protein [Flavihumibacter sp. ZG627]